jgi:hypothetical protein
MWRINERGELVSGGRFGFGAAVIRAIAAAGMTMAVCDVAAAYYVAEVLVTCDGSPKAKPRKSRLLADGMFFGQADHARSFTCCESQPTKARTPWCCDWKEGWKAPGWQCWRGPSEVRCPGYADGGFAWTWTG